jgi:hypothetical protein
LTPEIAGKFVEAWISANVTNVPGLEDLSREIERLACGFLTRATENKKPAAFAAGFT